MSDPIQTLRDIYTLFNARDIDGLFAKLTDDVAWANGMHGGHEHGKDAVRAYWTGQWQMVRAHVEPVSFEESADGAIVVRVIQTIRDLQGNPLEGQTHGLKDKTVGHVFHFTQGKVSRFDIADAE